MTDVLRKDQLEKSLFDEKRLIKSGELKEDNPLDLSPAFGRLCDAARRGDLKVCQEAIQAGANINARDEYDYTPLILASLCGHYDVVQLLLESGALCERDTFQGERCLYNALNDRIRNLLLAYDYSKSTDPLQPFAAHIASLFNRPSPATSDFCIQAGPQSFLVHKFILTARSPFFRRKFQDGGVLASWALPERMAPPALAVVLRYLYLMEIPRDVSLGYGNEYPDEDVLTGIERLSKLFEIDDLMRRITGGDDRRAQRQARQVEVERGRTQLETWFRENSLAHTFEIDSDKADHVKWSKDNAIFADILLRADYEPVEDLTPPRSGLASPAEAELGSSNIPIGPMATPTAGSPAPSGRKPKSKLFPVHKAMLLRAEYFLNMFSSSFLEAQDSNFLRIVPVSCSPDILETILLFFYSERANFGLQSAIDVLFAADMLLIERLKAKAAIVISSLGNGTMATENDGEAPRKDQVPPVDAAATDSDGPEHVHSEEDPLDPYATLRAAWDLRVPRLETFAARYFAYRLERYIDENEFIEVIRESAARIQGRQETDSIELVDDIRYFLSERFRLRFEGEGIEQMLSEDAKNEDERSLPEPIQDTDEGDDAKEQAIVVEAASTLGSLSLTNNARPDWVEDEDLLAEKQVIRTLDGEIAGDEFAAEALNYQILMGKIDKLLDDLQLDA